MFLWKLGMKFFQGSRKKYQPFLKGDICKYKWINYFSAIYFTFFTLFEFFRNENKQNVFDKGFSRTTHFVLATCQTKQYLLISLDVEIHFAPKHRGSNLLSESQSTAVHLKFITLSGFSQLSANRPKIPKMLSNIKDLVFQARSSPK